MFTTAVVLRVVGVVTRQADRQKAQSGPTEQGPNEGLPLELMGLELPIGESIRSYMDQLLRGQMGTESGQFQVLYVGS